MVNSITTICYASCLVFNRVRYYLLWQPSAEFGDRFVLSKPDRALLITEKHEELLSFAEEMKLTVAPEEPVVIDFDDFWRHLMHLKNGEPLSKEACRAILNGWNAMEDFARTFGIRNDLLSRGEGRAIQKAYENVFYGADVLDSTAPDELLPTVLTSRETTVVVSFIEGLRKNISKILLRSEKVPAIF